HVLRSAGSHLTRTAVYFLTLAEPHQARLLLRRLFDKGWISSDATARRRAGADGAPVSAGRDGIDCRVAVGFTSGGLEHLGHGYRPHPTHVVEPEYEHAFGQWMLARAE